LVLGDAPVIDGRGHWMCSPSGGVGPVAATGLAEQCTDNEAPGTDRRAGVRLLSCLAAATVMMAARARIIRCATCLAWPAPGRGKESAGGLAVPEPHEAP
jgi:hypothetical protein